MQEDTAAGASQEELIEKLVKILIYTNITQLSILYSFDLILII